jgi:predicted MFS family arabinose efflux permease
MDFRDARLPRHGIALLEALQFSRTDCAGLERLGRGDWEKLLALCDDTQLTLLIGHLCRPFLPDWVRVRIEKNYLDNSYRFDRLKEGIFEISSRFAQRSLEFCLLKGFAHSPDFTPDPLLRAQGDIDIWCLPSQILDAKDELLALGYRPFGNSKGRHLDPMIRDTNWEWRGDYFARDLPMPVDLHFSLWDEKLERVSGPREEALWSRRCCVAIDGHSIPALDRADALTFAALHLMMHLLHGDLRLQRAWEIGHFLESQAGDDEFWLRWQSLYSIEMRRLPVIAFALTHRWFGCRLSALIAQEVDALPEDISLWLSRYGLSPLEGLFVPNKDEVWLNLCLLKSFGDKAMVLSRRLIPLRAAVAETTAKNGQSNNASQPLSRIAFLLRRCTHHLRTLPFTCFHGFEWWWMRQRLRQGFLRFVFASALFDFGEFVFFLLYNLYLLERGFDEKFIGQVAAALTAGTFVGVTPAAEITRRAGLRRAVMIAIVGTAAANVFRSLAHGKAALIGSAFLNGMFMSFWAVSLPPAVAELTNSRNRTFGFSLISSVGIGMGALAGFLGGRLPALLVALKPSLASIESKRAALLIGSSIAAVAIVPAARLLFSTLPPMETGKKKYPRGPFVYAFLAALFIWSVGTGGFNPFFNVYFSRYFHVTVAQIGLVSCYAQITQVAAIPLAPLILKRVGDVRGIAGMQLATAAALGLLALTSNSLLGALLYVLYMSFQYMSEPCLLSMLMSRVDRSEQNGASALNFLVTSLAGILAATAAGAMLSHLGYKSTFATCAAVIAIAAMGFYFFLREQP